MKNLATRKSTEAPQKTTAEGGRVFTFPHKRIPVVTREMWQQMKAAARTPHKGRQYPEIIEVPDGSI
ncbi:hypothetical protein [Diaphorobacter caeni]|uniref:hypothetical protein n=1 Tax=Diaphorobacter caeni TaxID=2784387 RepID=UPI00188E0B28|nr:hypothetical protein [Diaphorobacter caeni]MBF5007155.1 hypothetical protein [Diaphorobacter caeni]